MATRFYQTRFSAPARDLPRRYPITRGGGFVAPKDL